ncbi:hypothetical protein ACFQ4J_06680 [Laceyella tengchongensis]
MADIYKITPGNIIGGPGRLVVKSYDGIFPEKISEVMDLTAPYNLKPGWKDLGATREGITTARGFDTEDFEVDQVGVVDTYITSWTHTLETQLAENTIENRQLALVGGTILETPPVLGTAVTLSAEVAAQATILNLSATTGLQEGSWIKIGTEIKRIRQVSGNSVFLTEPVVKGYPASENVFPIVELGTKRIGFGAVADVPFMTYALISQKKDGTLYMCVIRKAKVTGDEKEQTYSREKRMLPLQLQAFPVEGLPETEDVYYEIEEVRA